MQFVRLPEKQDETSICELSSKEECFGGTLNAPLPVTPSAETSVLCLQLKGGNKDSRAGWLPDGTGNLSFPHLYYIKYNIQDF